MDFPFLNIIALRSRSRLNHGMTIQFTLCVDTSERRLQDVVGGVLDLHLSTTHGGWGKEVGLVTSPLIESHLMHLNNDTIPPCELFIKERVLAYKKIISHKETKQNNTQHKQNKYTNNPTHKRNVGRLLYHTHGQGLGWVVSTSPPSATPRTSQSRVQARRRSRPAGSRTTRPSRGQGPPRRPS